MKILTCLLISLPLILLVCEENRVNADTKLAQQINGRITFVSDRDGNNEIYSMREDGSDVTQITFSDSDDVYPAWSPDGNLIAFSSNRDGVTYDIFIINADGSEPLNLTQDPSSNDRYPAWSPDGNLIAFSKSLSHGSDIYLLDTNNNIQTLLVDGGGETYNLFPTWSPDGVELMFTSSDDLPGPTTLSAIRVERINVDGSLRQRIGAGGINTYGHLDWSWANNEIAFYDIDLANNIFIMNVDVSNIKIITNANANNREFYSYPAWAPDGIRVAYQGRNFGESDSDDDIYVTNLDTGITLNLTQNSPYNEMQPDWQPVMLTFGLDPLRLSSLCSPSPDTVRVWRVRNTNTNTVDFTWDVVGTDQTGSGTVPGGSADNPGEVTFETVTVDGLNTTRILVNGEQQDIQDSTTEACASLTATPSGG